MEETKDEVSVCISLNSSSYNFLSNLIFKFYLQLYLVIAVSLPFVVAIKLLTCPFVNGLVCAKNLVVFSPSGFLQNLH